MFYNLGPGRELETVADTKNSKTIKSTFFHNHLVFLAENMYGALMKS